MAPLGYLNNRETKQIYVDKEKSPFIKKAFEAYASGKYTLKEIRKIINGLGLRGRRDKMLSVSNYQYLLQNPFYYGLIRYNGEYFEGKHEPIIAKKLFNQCQEVMKQKSKPQKVDEMKFFLYRGFFHCGECGFTITADKKIKPSEKEYTYYYCTKKNPNHICSQNVFTREEKISSQINEAIQKVSLPDDWADKMLNELENEKNEKAQSSRFFAQKIQDEIEVVDEKLEKLMNAYLENALSLAEYREVKNKLVNQKQFLKDKLTAFEQKSDNRFELATRFINTIKQAEIIALQENPEQGRDFLKKIGSNFRLSGQKLFLDFKFPFKITAEAELERSEGGATTLKNAEIVNWRKRRDSVTSIFSDEKISSTPSRGAHLALRANSHIAPTFSSLRTPSSWRPPFPCSRCSLRKRRDSNPRCPFGHDSFQDCCLQPLGHASKTFLYYPLQKLKSSKKYLASREKILLPLQCPKTNREKPCFLEKIKLQFDGCI